MPCHKLASPVGTVPVGFSLSFLLSQVGLSRTKGRPRSCQTLVGQHEAHSARTLWRRHRHVRARLHTAGADATQTLIPCGLEARGQLRFPSDFFHLPVWQQAVDLSLTFQLVPRPAEGERGTAGTIFLWIYDLRPRPSWPLHPASIQ